MIDTNVLFRGVTNPATDDGSVVAAWIMGSIAPCVSPPLWIEYEAVFERMLSAARLPGIRALLRGLLESRHLVKVTRTSFRFDALDPIAPDPRDAAVIQCAFDARAGSIVTHNRKHFHAARALGVQVLQPEELMSLVRG